MMFKSKIGACIMTVAVFALSVTTAGCASARLDHPQGLEIDDNYRLSWDIVNDARGYVVEIVDSAGNRTENNSRRAYLSLSYLEEGDYEIRIKATSDGKNADDSSWSETVYFHKDYENGCLYNLINNNSEYEIAKLGTAGEEIVFEDLYRGKPVTAVADGAFRGGKILKKVELGKYVKTIGKGAFYNCVNLEQIVLPESLTDIGESAFQACGSLVSVVFPENLKAIGDSAFSYCHSLSELDLDGIETIGSLAFANCENITDLVIPDSVTDIAGNAFSNMKGLKSVRMNSTLETLNTGVFRYCSALEEVEFAEEGNLKEIGTYVFSECTSLKEIAFPEGLQTIGYGACLLDSSLESVSIPDSVTQVGAHAFYRSKFYDDAMLRGDGFVYADDWLVEISVGDEESDCTNVTLENITVDTLKAGTVGIANWAFMSCLKLSSIELASSVKYVGDYAFAGCENLYRLETYGLKEIGKRAFYQCAALERLYLGEGLEVIENEAFRNTAVANPNNRNIIPSTVTRIGSRAFYETKLWNDADRYGVIYAGNWIVGTQEKDKSDTNSGLKSEIVIANPYYQEVGDDATVNIADYAFFNAAYLLAAEDIWVVDPDGLKTVDGMQNVKRIGKGAFYGCNNLSDIYISNYITKIEDYTFYGCRSLSQVIIPNSLKEIGRSAFYDCENLRNVMNSRIQSLFPDFRGLNLYGSGVTKIGDFAFKGTRIENVDLGDKVECVGKAAFYRCASLVGVAMSDPVSAIDYGTFADCKKLSNIEFGSSVTKIDELAFYNCRNLTEVTLPDAVKSIGDFAFYGSGLERIDLGSNLERIGDYAFALSNLSEISLPSTLKSIGDFAFRNCGALRSVTLREGVREIGKHVFLGCGNATVYLESATVPDGWSATWNSQFCPTVAGCTLSEDGAVLSVTIGEGTVNYVVSVEGYQTELNAPYRKGYVFSGWATGQDATEAEYSSRELASLPAGTTVYAVWSPVGSESIDKNA